LKILENLIKDKWNKFREEEELIPFIKDVLLITVNPLFWGLHNPYSSLWNSEFNRVLKTEKFVRVNEWTAKIGPYFVGMVDYPYRIFYPVYDEMVIGYDETVPEVRPSRLTILRAKRKLDKELEVEDKNNLDIEVKKYIERTRNDQ
jgi:hypothetical protein